LANLVTIAIKEIFKFHKLCQNIERIY